MSSSEEFFDNINHTGHNPPLVPADYQPLRPRDLPPEEAVFCPAEDRVFVDPEGRLRLWPSPLSAEELTISDDVRGLIGFTAVDVYPSDEDYRKGATFERHFLADITGINQGDIDPASKFEEPPDESERPHFISGIVYDDEDELCYTGDEQFAAAAMRLHLETLRRTPKAKPAPSPDTAGTHPGYE